MIKTKITCLIALLFVSTSIFSQATTDIRKYIDKYKKLALEQEKEYGIPAPIILAQGILESGAGKSKLTMHSNNHFGIKESADWNGQIYYAWDDEPQMSAFRRYDSAEESYKDHSLFLKNNSRYNSLFSKSIYDYRSWAWGLQNAGYASAKNYAKALIGYIDAYRLYSINGGIKLRPGKTVVITRYITKEKPEFDNECQLEDSEKTEEEQNVTNTINRFIVEINNLRCTILFPGEELSTISQKYGIQKAKLLEYNEVQNESDLNEGDIIFLERKRNKYQGAQDFYKVREGDTMYNISQMFGIRLAKLSQMNNKSIFSKLKKGDLLKLK